MSDFDDACRDVVSGLEGAIVCGVVDLDTGMLVGVHVSPGFPGSLHAMVTRAALDLFRGPNVDRIERMIRDHREQAELPGPAFQELHVTSGECFHFAKLLDDGKTAIVLVTTKRINQGLGWAQLKSALPRLETTR
jgi:hypothetical protein